MQKTVVLILPFILLASCHSESYSVKGCPKVSGAELETFNQKVAEIKQKANHNLTIEHKIVDGCETRTVKRLGS